MNHRTALITGGGRGIGKAIALSLAAEGVRVCVISRTEHELAAVCETIKASGGQAVYQVFDLADREGLLSLKQAIIQQIGSIDILIHNASMPLPPKKLTYMIEENWYKTLDIDLNSLFRLARLFLNDMKENQWGRIIAIGSLSGMFGASSYPAYCAAKSALEGLVKNLAIDYSPYGITVNLISPGFIETERFKQAAPPALLETFIAATSVKRLGKPEDIADTVAFLASDQASYITGVNLPVCGGLNLGNLW